MAKLRGKLGNLSRKLANKKASEQDRKMWDAEFAKATQELTQVAAEFSLLEGQKEFKKEIKEVMK